MTSHESHAWPSWKHPDHYDGRIPQWWTDKSELLERFAEASRKNKEGNESVAESSSASLLGEPAGQPRGSKRYRSQSPAQDAPSHKEMKITVADASGENVDRAGNAIKNDTKWILQEDPCVLGHPVTQAMWLVLEPPYQGYGQPWFRPATQLSDLLEAQLKADIGCQTCILEYPKDNGESTKHYFEHDLRLSEWVQRRYYDEEKLHLKSVKQIVRVMVG